MPYSDLSIESDGNIDPYNNQGYYDPGYDDYSGSGYFYDLNNETTVEYLLGSLLFTLSISLSCRFWENLLRKRKEQQFNRSLNQLLITENLQETCSICLDNFLKKEIVIKLRCNHMFHKKCFQEWIKTGRTCPLCRIII
jgi:hypothetical protein